MEHIIQFGIGIDDQRIVKSIEANAERIITADIKQKVYDNMFESRCYGGHGDPNNGFSYWMKGRIEDFMREHKDLIIEMAGKFLAEKLSRTRAAKELLTAPGGKKEE